MVERCGAVILLHPRQLFGQPRELLIGTCDLFIGMRQPFIGVGGQDIVGAAMTLSASVDLDITVESIGTPFPVRVPRTRAVRFVHEPAKDSLKL